MRGCYGLNIKCPPKAHSRTPGPQLVALFWEVLETLGGEASGEEVGH
jgi:hypothetical protein